MIMYEKQKEPKLNAEEIQQLFEKVEKKFQANTFGTFSQSELDMPLITGSKAPSEA